jgi:hypothetical protein
MHEFGPCLPILLIHRIPPLLEQPVFHEQIHTPVIDDESMPWMPFAPHSSEVLIRYFKADPIRRETIT